MGKLKSIIRNPRFILAYKGIAFAVLLGLFQWFPGWLTGALFIGGAGWLYFQPLFNVLFLLPLAAAVGVAGMWWRPEYGAGQWLLLITLAILFAILIGVKNLILTHRQGWIYTIVCVISYLIILHFFLFSAALSFVFIWGATVLLLLCAAVPLVNNGIRLLTMGVIAAEVIWVIAWLPIGSLSSSTLAFVVWLLSIEVFVERRISWKNILIFGALVAIILGASYWTF